jgi:uncharacterized protein (TIGR02145 family)
MLNFTNLKLKKIKLEKLGVLAIFAVFTIASFLTGSSVSNAAASGTALPISFGGTGATTQASALTNLGINNTIDENSSNGTFPSAKTVYNYMSKTLNTGYISMDNINFSDSITSWTGGDLIYKGSDLSSTATNNKIKVGDKACTTSGQGYTSDSSAEDGIPQVGCVLPDLATGIHAVTISTDDGTNYTIRAGKVIYTETPTLPNCDTTSMQTFGANAAACKAAMKQGQVIVLNDTRDNQKYRVKKMPDGNVWMIDNWKYSSRIYYNPSEQSYCTSSGAVNTHNPGNTTACGYLYNWSTALTVSPSGWSLYLDSGEKSVYELSNKMLAAAANSNSNRNPVYSAVDYRNFNEGGTSYPAPWLGVYSGYVSADTGDFNYQGIDGSYWSSTSYGVDRAYSLRYGSYRLYTQNNNVRTSYFSVRSVL